MADRGTLFLDEVGELPPRPADQVPARPRGAPVRAGRRPARARRRRPRRRRHQPRARRDGPARHVPRGPLLPAQRDPDRGPAAARIASTTSRCSPSSSSPGSAARPPAGISGFAPDAIAAMTRYAWPGNVRELRNAVERAVVLGDREQIIAPDLPPRSSPPSPRRAPGRRRRPRPLGSNSVALPAVTIDPLPLPPPPPPSAAPPPLPRRAPSAARALAARAREAGHPRRARRDRRQQGPGRRDPRDRPLDAVQEAQGLRHRRIGLITQTCERRGPLSPARLP